VRLDLIINNGAAFSIGQSSGNIFAIFAITFLAVIFYVGRRIDTNSWAICLGILAGGVSGNLCDRLFRAPGRLNGGVVDWIRLPHWPVFNLADVCISIGILIAVALTIRKTPLNSKRLKDG
jgi:signal peptidase II